MEGVVTNNVGILGFFCPKQGQAFRPPAAPLYPNMDQVPPPAPTPTPDVVVTYLENFNFCRQYSEYCFTFLLVLKLGSAPSTGLNLKPEIRITNNKVN